LIDTILEVPMTTVLENISIDQETKSVLLGGASRLRPLYQLMLEQESGEWEVAAGLANQLQLKDDEVSGIYWQALEWSRQVTGGEAEPAKAK